MAQPYVVNASTTLVQVDTITIPNTKVFLSTTSFLGQVVTVLENTNSDSITSYPILVSTNQSLIQNNPSLFSTLIDQPRGSLTALANASNQWRVINSFPFRDQFLSAGLINLNTSTLFAQVQSSLNESVSSIVTGNLLITGNLIVESNVIIQTNVSILKDVVFTSSLRVFGSTILSSGMSTIGSALLQSTLDVFGNVRIESGLSTLKDMSISSFVNILGNVSASNLSVGQGIYTGKLTILSTSSDALQIADSVTVFGFTSIQQDLTMTSLYTSSLVVNTESRVFRNTGIGGNLLVEGGGTFSNTLSVQQTVGIGGNLDISGSLQVSQNVFVPNQVNLLNTLETRSTLFLGSLSTNQASTSTLLASYGDVGAVSVLGDVGFGQLRLSNSTRVGDGISTFGDAQVEKLKVAGNITTQSSIFMTSFQTPEAKATVLGNLSVGGNLVATSGNLLQFLSSLYVGGNTEVNGTGTFSKNVSTSQLMFVTGDIILANLILPQTFVVLNNGLVTSSIYSGGFAQIPYLSTQVLQASTLVIGKDTPPHYTLDISGDLRASTSKLTTLSLSTHSFYQNIFSDKIWLAGGIAIGTSKSILTSRDGITWSNNTTAEGNFLQALSLANDGFTKWVAWGSNSVGNPFSFYSLDGYTWSLGNGLASQPTFQVSSNSGQCIAFGKGRWIAAGSRLSTASPFLVTSTDGITFSNITSGDFTDSIIREATCVLYAKGMWIAGGYAEIFNLYEPILRYSYDGLTWYGGTGAAVTNNFTVIYSLDYDPSTNTFIAGSVFSFFRSSDGINWTLQTSSPPLSRRYSTNGKGRWVAPYIGTNLEMYYSDDEGNNWTQSAFTVTFQIGDQYSVKQLVWGGDKWVMILELNIASTTKQYFYYSYDGNNWFTGTASPGFGTGGYPNTISYSLAPNYFINASTLTYKTNEQTEGLLVGTDAVLQASVKTGNAISTASLLAPSIGGSFVGDGSLISNVALPTNLTVNTFFTSTFSTVNLSTNIGYTSSLFVNSQLQALSTLQIGDILLQGNVLGQPSYIQRNNDILAYSTQLIFNEVLQVGVKNDEYPVATDSIVGVKTNPVNTVLPSITPFTGLIVNGTLAATGIVPNFEGSLIVGKSNLQNYQTVQANNLILSSYTTSTVYVSSGYMDFSSLLFLPLNQSQSPLSTNIIQGTSNNVSLNSTLFVNLTRSTVGINTQMSNFSLQVSDSLNTSTFLTSSLLVQSQLRAQTTTSNLLFAYLNDGTILSSQNGSNWALAAAAPSLIYSAAYNGRNWIGVGPPLNNTSYGFFTSSNGSNWIELPNSGIPSGYQNVTMNQVAWNGQYWLAAGGNQVTTGLLRSFDGSNWTDATGGGFSGIGTVFTVAWNGQYWLAGGQGGTFSRIQKSLDGLNWTPLSGSPPSNPNTIYGLAWNGQRWVAVGNSSNIITSTDGLNWTNTSSNAWGSTATGSNVSWNGQYFVAVGTGGILRSLDGITWTNVNSNLTKCILWNGTFWLAGGSTGIYRSFNGSSWSNVIGANTLAFASYSNVIPMAQLSNLTLWDNPVGDVLYLRSTPYMAFYPSSMVVNDTFQVDFQQNRFIFPANSTENLASFQVTPGILRAQNRTSTSQIKIGSLILPIQTV